MSQTPYKKEKKGLNLDLQGGDDLARIMVSEVGM
jgi:hypothetical protein